jgi:LysM repeat protein
MGQSRKRINYLDYPLFPPQRRPWGRLILVGVVLGMLAYIGWGWLAQTLLPSKLVSPILDGVLVPSRVSAPEGARVVLVHSVVITPSPAVSPAPSPFLSAREGELVDEVDEVEISWAERGGREKIITYAVQSGDTLWDIADQFSLDLDTLRWSNPDLERNPDLLPVGMELVILPVTGVYHTVQAGETLGAVAQRYGVAEVDILNYPLNELTSADDLRVGQRIVVPHGRKDLVRPIPQPSQDSPFAWPLVGAITQGFSDAHRAIDIGAPYGSPVYAGREGQVIRSGWARTGYGYTVIIDHGEGLQSLYSHMKGEWVQVGDWVERGQLIGEVGSTGNSSGPHVHFEVRFDGERMNPMDYLPPGEPR